jgi:hypothetical protein
MQPSTGNAVTPRLGNTIPEHGTVPRGKLINAPVSPEAAEVLTKEHAELVKLQ